MEHHSYNVNKAVELISMWMDCRKYDYKPSDFREDNRILSEDMNAFAIIEQMYEDGQKYQQELEKVKQTNEAYVKEEQAKFRASKGIKG